MKKRNLINTMLIVILFCSCSNNKQGTELENRLNSVQQELDQLKNEKETEEANKKMVAEFYQALFGDKNIDMIDKYIAEDYIQHNPILPDGRKPLKDWVTNIFKDAPKEQVDIHHLSADSNLVYIHTRAKFGNKIYSVIDIFRVEDGIIHEHWDVMQEVPEKSANPHPMF